MAKKKAAKKVAKKTTVKKPAKKSTKTKAAESPPADQEGGEDEPDGPAEPSRLTEEGRRLLIPVTKFCKHGWDQSEEGDEKVQIKVRVPDSHCCGESAHHFFGNKRLRIRLSRRSVGEWGQQTIPDVDSPTAIHQCEAEVPSFSWSGGDFRFAFWTDQISEEVAKQLYRKAGSIELTVLGDVLAVESNGQAPAATNGAPKKTGRPPKPKAEPKPKGPTLPGASPDELADVHSVALTDSFRVEIKVIGTPEGDFSCQWSGFGPTGEIEEPEPSVRKSIKEAILASIGRAVDVWRDWSGDEEKQVVSILQVWLREIQAGKTAALIESEMMEEQEDEEGDEEEDDEE